MNISTNTASLPNKRFDKILEDDLCIGCAICAALAGSDITMQKDGQGELRPVAHNPLSAKLVDEIYDICPGTWVEGLPVELSRECVKNDTVWGPYMDMVLAFAGDPNVRFEGATAGGLTAALGQYLLAAAKVDFVYHVGAHPDEPIMGAGKIIRTPQEVLDGAGLRYGPTAMLAQIEDVLSMCAQMGETFALIGKPCDLGALRNLARSDARVDKYVKYWLTPVCRGYMPASSMTAFLKRGDIAPSELSSFRYRGLGCPGPSTAHLKDGSRRDWHYLDFWGEDESAWSLPFRCKICPDGIGESADIAAADTWPGGSPEREASQSDPGTNSLIIRTWAGMEIVAGAIAAGYLRVGAAVDTAYMNATQPHQEAKKRKMGARYDGLQRAGSLVPKTRNLRIGTLSDQLDKVTYKTESEGAYTRARKKRDKSV